MYPDVQRFLFLSTPSARRATINKTFNRQKDNISIHALREEGDRDGHAGAHLSRVFLSTPSARRATGALPVVRKRHKFLSTPSARRATGLVFLDKRFSIISIHALLAEGDRALCATLPSGMVFLSTPSARRATEALRATRVLCRHFYPRPPRGGRLYWLRYLALMSSISIHALREEGDCQSMRQRCALRYFYPRPPRGGRLFRFFVGFGHVVISIHALREEGDSSRAGRSRFPTDFYPRPPRGGRPDDREKVMQILKISIHALREEGDLKIVR